MLCVFDVNETLLDLAALDGFFTELTGTPQARREWFDLMIHSALTLTAAGSYQPFGQIAAACLPPIAARHSRTATGDHQSELGARMRRLPAHPEVPEAMNRLRQAGFDLVALTNSTIEVAEDQLRNAGLRDLLHAVHSADQVHRLKPAPDPYRHVLAATHSAPDQAVMIAAHDWDIAGAATAGLLTAFISRDARTPLPAAPAPTWTAPDLRALTDQLLASPTGKE